MARLRAKINELSAICTETTPLIVGITETWLSTDIRDSEVHLPGLSIYRKDRTDGRAGGGVAVYLPEDLTVTILDSAPWSALPDSLWCSFRNDSTTTTLLGIVYRPPNPSAEADEVLLSALNALTNTRNSNILILGDFNLPQLDFTLMNVQGSENSFASRFLKAIVDAGLTEHVQDDTRISHSLSTSRLDLIFTNEPLMISNTSCHAPLGLSDHCLIQFDYTSNSSCTQREHRPRHIYRKANYAAIKEGLLQIPWETNYYATVDDNWLFLKETLLSLINSFVPKKTPGLSRSRHWLRRSTIKTIALKRKAWADHRREGTSISRSHYNTLRNKCNTEVRSDRSKHQKNLAKRVKENPKSFYSYISSISKAKPGIPALSNGAGQTSTDREAADMLASQFFDSMGPTLSPLETKTTQSHSSIPPLTDVRFTHTDVERVLSRLNANKSPGPDAFPPCLFKECAKELVMPLYHLFEHSLRVGKLPRESTSEQRDLGTLITSTLSLTSNTMASVRKANSVSYLLRRNLGCILPQYFTPIFCSLVRPLLEVNIQACAPNLQKDITALEKVQRRATKKAAGLSKLSYPARLNKLGLFSLEYRRLRGDMILAHKILHTKDHPCRSLLTLSANQQLRGHPLKLAHRTSRRNIRHHSFAVRVPRYWNRLPVSVIMSKTTNEFKHKFDAIHTNHYCNIGLRPYDLFPKIIPQRLSDQTE
ncbi:UNVERIFIED_CONTAM: hypothetical protein B566_EDAN019511 [Ephemera danica]|nr:hypothetical protein B566_EDAN019511 [Ephemera danica]